MHIFPFSKEDKKPFWWKQHLTEASGWAFPMAAIELHLRASVANKHTVNFNGEQLTGYSPV